jgi:D-aminopeptidase
MTARTFWESFTTEGENVAERLKQVVHEGNVRRVVVKQRDRVVAEFTLTAGVVGTVIAPVLAAIGALVAMMQDCTIEVERTPTEPSLPKESASCSEPSQL